MLVDKYHRLILNPHQQHGIQRRSHRSLLVADPLLQLDPPAMAYVPILQTTVRQQPVRLTLLLTTTVGFIKTCSNAHIMGSFIPHPSGPHPPDPPDQRVSHGQEQITLQPVAFQSHSTVSDFLWSLL